MNIMKNLNHNIINIQTLWLLMVLLTVSSYVVGKIGFNGQLSVFILLLTAVIKGSFIIRDFMALRGVSLLWRVIMYGWLWGVTLSIATIYLFSL